jgi:hypothetical protein
VGHRAADRRGIGCVYSSRFLDDERAKRSCATMSRARPTRRPTLNPRRCQFPDRPPRRILARQLLAIGLSAGFIEPLEASAIVMIELSLNALIDNFPASRETMPIHAARFNALFRTRWDRVVEFLKLHYLLSRRDEPYWRAQRDPATFPPRLAELVELWRDQPPSATICRSPTRSSRPRATNMSITGWAAPCRAICRRRRGDAPQVRPGSPAHARPACRAPIQPRAARSASAAPAKREKVVQP